MENPSSVEAAGPLSEVTWVTTPISKGHWQVFRGRLLAGNPTGFALTPQNLIYSKYRVSTKTVYTFVY